MTAVRQRVFFILRLTGKILFYGFLVAVAINVPFVAIDVYHNLSKADVFDKIQIGMPALEVEHILYDAASYAASTPTHRVCVTFRIFGVTTILRSIPICRKSARNLTTSKTAGG